MDEYADAKKNIYHTEECTRLVTNLDNDVTRDVLQTLERDGIKKIAFSRKEQSCDFSDGMIYLDEGNIIIREGACETLLVDTAKIKLPGTHNIENYMAAAGAVWGLGFDEADFVDVIRSTAQSFGGVEHRLEFVRELGGVDFYNSSIDSSPTRTAAALRAFSDKSVVICGGYDKHIPLEPLAEVLCECAEYVILCGATANAIAEALENCPDFDRELLGYTIEPDFERAIKLAAEHAREGGRVVLSPACASFDMFRNFEERGRRFKEIVNSLK